MRDFVKARTSIEFRYPVECPVPSPTTPTIPSTSRFRGNCPLDFRPLRI
jgi:hypothetical protein